MGTRVTTVLQYANKTKTDDIFFSNTTSFNTIEVLDEKIKELTLSHGSLEDLREYLLDYKQYSNIANREEGFILDSDEPFGDFEYILFVRESEDNTFTLSKMDYLSYMQVANLSQKTLNYLEKER